MKTRQNFSGGDSGGGGVRYSAATCLIKAAGCAVMWAIDEENLVCVTAVITGDGASACRTSREVAEDRDQMSANALNKVTYFLWYV